MFKIKADRMSREAWQFLGKARELRYNMQIGNTCLDQDYTCEMIRHQVRLARMALGTAITYRRIG